MKLRFAPSPTGLLHVGGARTAIFNLLHARRYGARMLLRIEDTDVERSKQHHAEQIVSSLQWLGIDWDEGPVFQSDRLDRYRQRVEQLLEDGAAYRCYCSVEELDAQRAAAERAGRQYKYSGKCRLASENGLQAGIGSNVVRFKVPSGVIGFEDLIRGNVQFQGEQIDDFVLLRSDGFPTYHLSVVVDDIDMEITIVARGDDHLSNTPKHILLFQALAAPVPTFAHLPLILGSDRKRLSKRTGATSAEEYRDLGVLPDALFNFLMLLGWAPGGDREILSRLEGAELFDLRDVNKAPAVFDEEKLLWLNGQYLNKLSPAEIYPHLQRFLNFETDEMERLFAVIALHRNRVRTLKDLADLVRPYFGSDEQLQYEDEAVDKHLRASGVRDRMNELREALEKVETFDVTSSEAALRALAERVGVGAGKYIHPMRVALTGKANSPPIFDVAVSLGKERVLRRIDVLLERLSELR